MTSLELFLLGLIDRGINTPYLFRERALLSVGATLPALERLREAGLVAANERGQRNKKEFTLTAKGKRTLRTTVPQMLHDYEKNQPTDLESVLRVVSLTLADGDSERAIALIRSVAAERIQHTRPLKSKVDLGNVSDSYSDFLASIQNARLRAEGEALETLASALASAAPRPPQHQGTHRKREKQ